MTKFKTTLYIIIVLALAIFAILFFEFGRGLVGISDSAGKLNEITDLKAAVADDDYEIYWIGEVPSRLKDLKVRQLDKSRFDSDDLPVRIENVEEERYEDKKKTYTQHTVVHDVPAYSLIVISEVVDLTPDEALLLRKCAVESGSKILVIGEDAVRSYRNFLLLPTGSVYVYGSMLYDYTTLENDVLPKESAKDQTSADFALDFLRFLSKETGH